MSNASSESEPHAAMESHLTALRLGFPVCMLGILTQPGLTRGEVSLPPDKPSEDSKH